MPGARPPSASSMQVPGNQQKHFLAPSILCLRRLHTEARYLLPKQRTLSPEPLCTPFHCGWHLLSGGAWASCHHQGFLLIPGLHGFLLSKQTHPSPPPTRQRRFIHRSCCPADRCSGLLALQPGMLLTPKVKGHATHSHPPVGQLLLRIIQEF